MKNLLSLFCSCVLPKTENITLKIEYTDNCLNETNFLKYKTNTKFIDKRISTSISQINQSNINDKSNCSISNLKLDIPFQNSLNCSNLSNISNSPSNISSIRSLNSQKYKKYISKNKMSKRFINENEIFNRFQNNVDNIIDEIKDKKTISESDDSEMC